MTLIMTKYTTRSLPMCSLEDTRLVAYLQETLGKDDGGSQATIWLAPKDVKRFSDPAVVQIFLEHLAAVTDNSIVCEFDRGSDANHGDWCTISASLRS